MPSHMAQRNTTPAGNHGRERHTSPPSRIFRYEAGRIPRHLSNHRHSLEGDNESLLPFHPPVRRSLSQERKESRDPKRTTTPQQHSQLRVRELIIRLLERCTNFGPRSLRCLLTMGGGALPPAISGDRRMAPPIMRAP